MSVSSVTITLFREAVKVPLSKGSFETELFKKYYFRRCSCLCHHCIRAFFSVKLFLEKVLLRMMWKSVAWKARNQLYSIPLRYFVVSAPQLSALLCWLVLCACVNDYHCLRNGLIVETTQEVVGTVTLCHRPAASHVQMLSSKAFSRTLSQQLLSVFSILSYLILSSEIFFRVCWYCFCTLWAPSYLFLR